MAARFEEAVGLAERAFAEEFARTVAHLCERVAAPADGGEPRVFRDSAVENLAGFFGWFRSLSVRSSPELDALVAEAQGAVRGVGPGDLRASGALRASVAADLGRVREALDGMLTDRPRRRILRTSLASAGGA